MHAYFRNHQLYLAERSEWMDRHVNKTSKRAMIKIDSWKMAYNSKNHSQLGLLYKMVKDSLLTPICNGMVLDREGYFKSNLCN
jgi:peptidyl-tRNA hydrolase